MLDVIGCDIGRAQGITGALQVIAARRAGGRVVQLARLVERGQHGSLDRALRFHAALPVQELKPQENPMQHELVDEPIVAAATAGSSVPRTPGLGVEPKESVLRRYRIGGTQ